MKLRTLLIASLASLISATLALQAQVPGINSTLDTVFTLAYDNSSMKQTYSATVSFTPPAVPSDVCSISGSATKTVKVRRAIIAGINSATIAEWVSVIKRSSANAGAGSALTKVPYDSSNAASTVVVAELWTGTPTLGTLVGVLADIRVTFGASNASTPAYTFWFGDLGQPVVLRGAAQQLSLHMAEGGGTGTLTCTFEWTEE